jgi:hypothetical protein
MSHDSPEWFDLDGRLTGLQQVPIVLQLGTVNLGPCFYQPLLRLWQASAQTLDRIHREDGGVVLIERVKVSAMVLCADLDEHPDDDPKKPRQFRHALPVGYSSGSATATAPLRDLSGGRRGTGRHAYGSRG